MISPEVTQTQSPARIRPTNCQRVSCDQIHDLSDASFDGLSELVRLLPVKIHLLTTSLWWGLKGFLVNYDEDSKTAIFFGESNRILWKVTK